MHTPAPAVHQCNLQTNLRRNWCVWGLLYCRSFRYAAEGYVNALWRIMWLIWNGQCWLQIPDHWSMGVPPVTACCVVRHCAASLTLPSSRYSSLYSGVLVFTSWEDLRSSHRLLVANVQLTDAMHCSHCLTVLVAACMYYLPHSIRDKLTLHCITYGGVSFK